ncbi:ndufa2, NADH:ubiquinone oxidoreductase 10.5kD subunit [Desmophyllum pertusum]|uniref:NADH dehydrogenase [ubiquinone] 1 alpha subcomplex subunit 2 n=1 Tax=Desmophyllum pertusum TaxID=174260 RepID=A0A9X0CSN9_9CNID|nr:ndufa2, NADH:ubiquinone oxidoreductase 10.5kD subunit [Desmophyllum pertusum]
MSLLVIPCEQTARRVMNLLHVETKTTGVHEEECDCTFDFLLRDFLEKYYIGIKKENPKIPILVRECSGIQPKMYARYDHGKESSVQLNNMNGDGVLQAMETLVTSAAP